jgi:uncharacterized protein YijF (DUF1287 family)
VGVLGRFDAQVTLSLPPQVTPATTRIRVDKQRRVLVLYHHDVPVKAYPIALGFAPAGDKARQGDGRTPEGRYVIVEARRPPLEAKYGARSLLLSYPSVRDADRGLRTGLITAAQHAAIRAAETAGRIPPQGTRLGSSIRIHGGGVGRDWTLGCVAMRDPDIVELYDRVKVGTVVEVLPAIREGDRDGDGIPDQVDVAAGGKKVALLADRYQDGYFRLPYPNGDVPERLGVCTDVVIRALRNAGYDLQSLLHVDVKAHPRRYPDIVRPDANIDHRRVRNLVRYFQAHHRLLATTVTAATRHTLLPGDVVFLDTLPRSGPDHLGIVSDSVSTNGWPRVINNWTVGYHSQEMDLLPQIPITHHFRLKPAAAGRVTLRR